MENHFSERTRFSFAFASLIILQLTIMSCSQGFHANRVTSTTGSSFSPVIDGKALYTNRCASCHGTIASSIKIGITADKLRTALASVPNMRDIQLSEAEISALVLALIPAGSKKHFSCDDPRLFSATPLQRLTKSQYRNLITSLFGNEVVDAIKSAVDGLPEDFTGNGTEISEFIPAYSTSHVNDFKRIAGLLSARTIASSTVLTRIGGSCLKPQPLRPLLVVTLLFRTSA